MIFDRIYYWSKDRWLEIRVGAGQLLSDTFNAIDQTAYAIAGSSEQGPPSNPPTPTELATWASQRKTP